MIHEREITKEDIEAVAEAMWNCDAQREARLSWDQLNPVMDRPLKNEMRKQAVAAIKCFLSRRPVQ